MQKSKKTAKILFFIEKRDRNLGLVIFVIFVLDSGSKRDFGQFAAERVEIELREVESSDGERFRVDVRLNASARGGIGRGGRLRRGLRRVLRERGRSDVVDFVNTCVLRERGRSDRRGDEQRGAEKSGRKSGENIASHKERLSNINISAMMRKRVKRKVGNVDNNDGEAARNREGTRRRRR